MLRIWQYSSSASVASAAWVGQVVADSPLHLLFRRRSRRRQCCRRQLWFPRDHRAASSIELALPVVSQASLHEPEQPLGLTRPSPPGPACTQVAVVGQVYHVLLGSWSVRGQSHKSLRAPPADITSDGLQQRPPAEVTHMQPALPAALPIAAQLPPVNPQIWLAHFSKASAGPQAAGRRQRHRWRGRHTHRSYSASRPALAP